MAPDRRTNGKNEEDQRKKDEGGRKEARNEKEKPKKKEDHTQKIDEADGRSLFEQQLNGQQSNKDKERKSRLDLMDYHPPPYVPGQTSMGLTEPPNGRRVSTARLVPGSSVHRQDPPRPSNESIPVRLKEQKQSEHLKQATMNPEGEKRSKQHTDRDARSTVTNGSNGYSYYASQSNEQPVVHPPSASAPAFGPAAPQKTNQASFHILYDCPFGLCPIYPPNQIPIPCAQQFENAREWRKHARKCPNLASAKKECKKWPVGCTMPGCVQRNRERPYQWNILDMEEFEDRLNHLEHHHVHHNYRMEPGCYDSNLADLLARYGINHA